ncbi:DUF3108 domain-containing protein [candidate division KSB1 bacterium]|nr:DUF3108 domain-containing protein [candidate division KSB1 bacterium]
MQMRIILLFLSFFILTAITAVHGQLGCQKTNQFTREKLHYTLKYGPVGSASACLTAEQTTGNDSLLVISCQMKTSPLTSLLFHIDNLYQSWLNIETGMPLKTKKMINQTNIRQQFTTIYHYDSLQAHTSDDKSWPILSGCLDLFGFIYHLRCTNRIKRSHGKVLIDLESHLWSVEVESAPAIDRFKKFKTIKMDRIVATLKPAGQIIPRAWKTDLLFNRLSKKGAKLVVYLGPPPRRIPYVMEFGSEKEMIRMQLNTEKSEYCFIE